jgi:hypothetical protein
MGRQLRLPHYQEALHSQPQVQVHRTPRTTQEAFDFHDPQQEIKTPEGTLHAADGTTTGAEAGTTSWEMYRGNGATLPSN